MKRRKVRKRDKKVSPRIILQVNISLARRHGNRYPSKNIKLYYRLKEEIYAKKKKSLLFVLRWKRESERIYTRTAI